MNTPIYDFVTEYIASDTSRLHMPGHKGTGRLGIEQRDITEIRGADELYEASGIIAESEKNAASLFGTGATYYSAEGSSHVIKTMLFLSLLRYRKHFPDALGRPFVLAARNVHKSFIFGCALLDLDAEWIWPDAGDLSSICSCHPEPGRLTARLRELLMEGRIPAAVYITSPDYLGFTADVSAICRGVREACASAGLLEDAVPVLVDNAHGAYLHFLGESLHPIDLGAWLCSDSAHKTLPVLTGGAYLQMSREAAEELGGEVRPALSMFGSTSPSYVILQSLDLCNAYLADGYRERLGETVLRLGKLKDSIRRGFAGLTPDPVVETEPLKLVLGARAFGISGTQLGDLLREFSAEPEFTDVNYVVLMFTPETPERDYERIEKALLSLREQVRDPAEAAAREEAGPLRLMPLPEAMSIREAVFSPHRTVPAAEAAGRVCGQTTVSCPPAIPIAVSGERITEEVVPLFLAYGIEELSVVAE